MNAAHSPMDAIRARDKEVESLIGRGELADALTAALTDPPFGSKDDAIKDANHKVVMKAVFATSEKKVAGVVDAIYARDAGLADNLMKYLYKGLERSENCGALLKWHAVCTEKAGLGPIVRSMTDRQRI